MKKNYISSLLLLIAILVLSSCSGKKKSLQKSFKVVSKNNETYILEYIENKSSFAGLYLLIEDKKLKEFQISFKTTDFIFKNCQIFIDNISLAFETKTKNDTITFPFENPLNLVLNKGEVNEEVNKKEIYFTAIFLNKLNNNDISTLTLKTFPNDLLMVISN